MPMSATDAASAAVERLRTLREQAKRRREHTREAVKQLRERNRRESHRLMEQAKVAKGRAQPWPASRPDRRMSLYEAEDVEAAVPPATPASQPPARPVPPVTPRRPVGTEDDDWSQETWLH